jgi:probable HAF family extracellular repeat protein
MDKRTLSRRTGLLASVAALAGVGGAGGTGGLAEAAPHAQTARPRYTITDLGTLGGPTSFPNGLSPDGLVAGGADTVAGLEHAFLWARGLMRDLGTLPGGEVSRAIKVNGRGQVVGLSTTEPGQELGQPGTHAFLWEGGVMRDLGTLPGGQVSRANGVNATGQVVGFSDSAEGTRATLWEQGRIVDLGVPPGFAASVAISLADDGRVVGYAGESTAAGPGSHAVMWDHGRIVDLGVLPGTDRSAAFGINGLGQIVGHGAQAPGTHALLWEGGVLRDLGLPAGFVTSAANKINRTGQVVGNALVGASPPAGPPAHGFLWQQGTWLDLNDLIRAEPGVELRGAGDINEAGQIIGPGATGGRIHAFLLTPLAPGGLPRTGGAGAA